MRRRKKKRTDEEEKGEVEEVWEVEEDEKAGQIQGEMGNEMKMKGACTCLTVPVKSHLPRRIRVEPSVASFHRDLHARVAHYVGKHMS